MSSMKTVAVDMLLVITSTHDELFIGIDIDDMNDLEPPK